MEDPLFSLGLLLIVAKLAEGLAMKLRQSALVAFVLTGIFLGPVFDLVETSPELSLFLGVGVVFLFFLIGIDELDIAGFVETLRGRFFLAAAVALLIPWALSFPVTYYLLDLSFASAIALSGVISLSSLGVVATVLSNLNHLKEPLGLEIFTTVVIVELVALLVVGFMLEEMESSGSFEAWKVGALVGQIAGFALVAWFLASRVFPPLVIRLRRIMGVPELAFGLLIGGLFLTVVGAEQIGLHGSLGALLLGSALSGIPHRLRTEILPGVRSVAQGLFIPLFFASAGLHLDTSFTTLSILTIMAVVAVAVFGKFAGSVLAGYVARLAAPWALASGLMAKGVVEIALLLLMLEAGAITQEIFSLLIIIMLAFIFVVPSFMGASIRRAKVREKSVTPKSVPPSFARHALYDIDVKDILDENRQFPEGSLTVNAFMEQWMTPDQQDYVVAEEEGQLAGILSLRPLRRLPRYRWEATPIANLLRRRVPQATPEEPLDDVLERMAEHNFSAIPVVELDSGKLLGAVTNQDVLGLLMEKKSE